MTVDELLEELKELAEKGYGDREILFNSLDGTLEPLSDGVLSVLKYYVTIG